MVQQTDGNCAQGLTRDTLWPVHLWTCHVTPTGKQMRETTLPTTSRMGHPNFRIGRNAVTHLRKCACPQMEQEARARQRLNDTHLSLAATTPKVIRCYVKRGEGISIDASENGTGPHKGENSMSIPAGAMVKRPNHNVKKMNFVTCARERLLTPSKLTLQEKMNFSLLEA